jgi:hypothetical protein
VKREPTNGVRHLLDQAVESSRKKKTFKNNGDNYYVDKMVKVDPCLTPCHRQIKQLNGTGKVIKI